MNFVRPPMVTVQPAATQAGTFTPLDQPILKKIVDILKGKEPAPHPVIPNKPVTWDEQDCHLLKTRYGRQGTLIPELRLPEDRGLIGLFTGRFTEQEITNKAAELGL